MKKLVVAVMVMMCAGIVNARDPAEVRKFRAKYACPSTGMKTGTCPTHVVDHIEPLCAGGRDHPSNMQWQQKEESYKKDAVERSYCAWLAKAAK